MSVVLIFLSPYLTTGEVWNYVHVLTSLKTVEVRWWKVECREEKSQPSMEIEVAITSGGRD